jgi:hypothetical protein
MVRRSRQRYGLPTRETRRRIVQQAAHHDRAPGIELAREHLGCLKTERAFVAKPVARPRVRWRR